MSFSIRNRHAGPNRLIAQMTRLEENAQSPKMVKSQPLPMLVSNGTPTTPPTHEKMFRMRLFTATPLDDFLGMNSVSIVVAIAKMSMDPTP